MIDNFFIDFDVNLCVAIEKLEYFDNIDSDIDVNVAKKIDKTNEQLNVAISTRFDVKFRVINIVAIFVCFDVISNVAIEKCEFFDDIDSDINVNVAKKIDKTNKQLNVAISTRFDVKFRVINIVAIFVCFDVISNVAIEKCEFFDDIDSDINVNVAKKIDKTNKQLNVAISTRFDVKFRVINIVAIFVCFDVISNIAIEKCEFFDDIDSNINVTISAQTF